MIIKDYNNPDFILVYVKKKCIISKYTLKNILIVTLNLKFPQCTKVTYIGNTSVLVTMATNIKSAK